MSYAARHPDLFSIALSYSGAPDIAYDAEAQSAGHADHQRHRGRARPGRAATRCSGRALTEEINWAAHDPTTLAANLRHTDLFMYTGNGQQGPLDSLVPNPEANVIESGVEQLTILFHNRLQALGIPSLFDDYGPGTHSWPYWARDLKWSIGPIMNDFAHPPATPSAVTYTSAEQRLLGLRLDGDHPPPGAGVQHAAERRQRRVHTPGQRQRHRADPGDLPPPHQVPRSPSAARPPPSTRRRQSA